MEIYQARMILNYDYKEDSNLVVWFDFEKDEHDDWIFQEDRNRFYRSEGWVSDECYSILMVECNNSLCIAKAEQGFDHELTLNEQQYLKEEMRNKMVEALSNKKKRLIENMEYQIDFLKNSKI